jgi:uridine kinase
MARDPMPPAVARLDRRVVGFDLLAAGVLAATPKCGGTRLVCVDGPSAAGKTDLAARLARALGDPPTLHMDDLYDGWDGLAEGVRRLRGLIDILATGRPARYARYDWSRGVYGTGVDLGTPPVLVVEGVGAGAVAARAVLTVWVETPDVTRYRRGMARDGEAYRPYWDRWAAQEREHYAEVPTRDVADVVVDGAPAVAYDAATQVVLTRA